MDNKNLKSKSKKSVAKKKIIKKTKSKKKAFTLIELLAVIIILGILMIIAVPSVTRYINGSKNSSYITTVKSLISGARNMVNDGKLGMFDTNVTYYIDTRCIKTENANKSPYGDFVKSYVLVEYDGKGYKYYWTGVDSKRKGTKDIIRNDYLQDSDIKTNVKADDIIENAGINGDEYYLLIDENCHKNDPQTGTIDIKGASGTNIVAIIERENPNDPNYYNSTIKLVAKVSGLDDCDYDIVFQVKDSNADNSTFVDVTNQSWATFPDKFRLHFKLNEETMGKTFRFVIRNVKRKTS